MQESKKKFFTIGAIIVILGIGGMAYYIFQSQNEDIDFEELDITVQSNVENSVESSVENEVEKEIVVHISGQVVNAGVISLKEGARIIDAINKAGGLTKEADINKVNLAYVLADAQKIYIPSVNDKEEVSFVSEGNEDSKIVTSGSNQSKEKEEALMININTASAEELQKLPGIGSSIAAKIVAYRKENGKFNTIEDIQNVSGIGTSKYNSIKNNICIK